MWLVGGTAYKLRPRLFWQVLLSMVHTWRWKSAKLAWICIECRNYVWWAQWCILWNAWDTNNFSFLLFNFSDFILILFCFLFDFILDNEEACDIAVTWHVTQYNVISLEHDGRIWKMMSGHMNTTWWSWVRYKADMRMKHGHKGRFNY